MKLNIMALHGVEANTAARIGLLFQAAGTGKPRWLAMTHRATEKAS